MEDTHNLKSAEPFAKAVQARELSTLMCLPPARFRKGLLFLEVEMNNKKVIVYVNGKLLTLLPEVAASFGWTDGQRITPEQAAKAQFVNALQALSNMVDDVCEAKR